MKLYIKNTNEDETLYKVYMKTYESHNSLRSGPRRWRGKRRRTGARRWRGEEGEPAAKPMLFALRPLINIQNARQIQPIKLN